jgi:hypothetical protein
VVHRRIRWRLDGKSRQDDGRAERLGKSLKTGQPYVGWLRLYVMTKLRLCLIVAVVTLFAAHSFAQTPSSAQLGRIEGIVLQAGATAPQPIGGARITVTKANAATGVNFQVPGRTDGTSLTNFGNTNLPGVQRGGVPTGPPPLLAPTALPIPPVYTDRDGRFVVPSLEEGSYRIQIALNGYVRQDYGQKVFPGQGTLINLAAGQVLKDVTIRLMPTGNISGRIIDNAGQPAVSVSLQLLKAIYNQQGQRIFQNAGQARTNDRGEYRFYWVTPGRYYLVGGNSPTTLSFGGTNSPNESGDTYVLTYYPGTGDFNRATSIDVKPGSDLSLDFVAPKQQLYTISGKVVDPNPVAAANGNLPAVTLSLAFQTLTGQSGLFQMSQAYDAKTGTFVIRDVIPGPYILQAGATTASARIPIEVTNANIEGLNVVVDGGITVNGRFMMDSGELPPASALRVLMRIMSNGVQNFTGYSPTIQPGADGTFSLPGVLPGQYRIFVQPPPTQDFYVKEIRYDRAEALSNAVDVSRRGADAGTMEILLSRAVGQVDGVIVDERGQPVPGTQAVLIPDNDRVRFELFKTATTDQTGRFTMRGIAPGDYKLFAWEALENFGYFDPDVLRRSEPLGKAVRVGEASKLSVEGKIIPAN